MPYIHSKVSVPMTAEQKSQLKSSLGQCISIFKGKSEHGLMLEISDCCQMYHGGEELAAIACIEVKLFGFQTEECYLLFTQKICGIYEQLLHIPAEHVYIIYESAAAWGSNYKNS